MKEISWYWNMVYYFLNRWSIVMQNIFSYPILFLLRNEKIKKQYIKRGIENPEAIVKDALNNSKTGTNSIITGIDMGVLLIMLEYSVFNIIQVIIGKSLIQYFYKDVISYILFLIIFMVPASIVNYFLLFKEDRYLEYFNKFDKSLKGKTYKYGWFVFLIILSFLLFFILSFVVLVKSAIKPYNI